MDHKKKIEAFVNTLGHAYQFAQKDVEKTKQVVKDIHRAHCAASLFLKEYTAVHEYGFDLDAAESDVTKYLNASNFDEKVIFSNILSSSTTATVSGCVSECWNPCEVDQYAETRAFLKEINQPIQSLHTSLSLTLEGISPHLKDMLHGAKASLEDVSNPLRSANMAVNLRELLREILIILAPDKSLQTAKWFAPDSTSSNGVTRRHRLTYAIYGYVNPSCFSSDFTTIVDEQISETLKTVSELSKYTHTTGDTLATKGLIEQSLYNRFLTQLADILALIEKARDLLHQNLELILCEEISSMFFSYTFDSLDELSTHTAATNTENLEVKITAITSETICYTGSGLVDCDLQVGSDGDCRRGDGLEWSMSFPFEYTGTADTEDITEISIDPNDVVVDTRKFFE